MIRLMLVLFRRLFPSAARVSLYAILLVAFTGCQTNVCSDGMKATMVGAVRDRFIGKAPAGVLRNIAAERDISTASVSYCDSGCFVIYLWWDDVVLMIGLRATVEHPMLPIDAAPLFPRILLEDSSNNAMLLNRSWVISKWDAVMEPSRLTKYKLPDK